MTKMGILGALFCALLAACSVDELVLTDAELQDLVDNYGAAQAAYSSLAEFTLNTALGEEDVEGFAYDPPTEANGWIGTSTFTGAALPSGQGDLTLTFRVLGDEGPVDPYTVDLSTQSSILLECQVVFQGTSLDGTPLAADAVFTWDVLLDDAAGTASFVLNGEFEISHGAYVAWLHPKDFTFIVDMNTETLTVGGEVTGIVDIPGYYFDARASVRGMGDVLETRVSIAGQAVQWTTPLSDF